ncbi:MAG: SDR family NAD(P)-dependent oxidoreductase [SAR324 cluster bacterium]|jgi:short-subunit dehydrogenase|nr:SDR family NAD(P)-dependent oxidoreductase [SAR324 cluster bacterium]
MRLADKSILITGATGSIGKETAKLFKKNGAKLALLGRDKKKLDELQAELGVDENTIYLEYEASLDSKSAT